MLVFFMWKRCTLDVYIIVGKKSTFLVCISYFAKSATTDALRVKFFYVFYTTACYGSLITSYIIISAYSPSFLYGIFYYYYFLSYFFTAFLASFLPPFFAASAYSYFLFFYYYFFFWIQSNYVLVTNFLTVIESSQSINSSEFCLICTASQIIARSLWVTDLWDLNTTVILLIVFAAMCPMLGINLKS